MIRAISRFLTFALPGCLILKAASALAATDAGGGANWLWRAWYTLKEMKLIPEPSTAVLVGLALGILLLFRKLLLPRRGKATRHG